jgi:hypothetical protein
VSGVTVVRISVNNCTRHRCGIAPGSEEFVLTLSDGREVAMVDDEYPRRTCRDTKTGARVPLADGLGDEIGNALWLYQTGRWYTVDHPERCHPVAAEPTPPKPSADEAEAMRAAYEATLFASS